MQTVVIVVFLAIVAAAVAGKGILFRKYAVSAYFLFQEIIE